ncbi:hypothetical protein [Pseudomonas sp. AK106]
MVTILEDCPTESFEFFVVFPSAKYLPERVMALADYLKHQLSQQSELQLIDA